MFLGLYDNFRLAVLINLVLIKKKSVVMNTLLVRIYYFEKINLIIFTLIKSSSKSASEPCWKASDPYRWGSFFLRHPV